MRAGILFSTLALIWLSMVTVQAAVHLDFTEPPLSLGYAQLQSAQGLIHNPAAGTLMMLGDNPKLRYLVGNQFPVDEEHHTHFRLVLGEVRQCVSPLCSPSFFSA